MGYAGRDTKYFRWLDGRVIMRCLYPSSGSAVAGGGSKRERWRYWLVSAGLPAAGPGRGDGRVVVRCCLLRTRRYYSSR